MNEYSKREKSEENESGYSQDILSKVIRAGKRTYFFDVRSTRNNEYYLVITESKRKIENDGNSFYEKHKIFLYKEDIENFTGVLREMADFIEANNPVREDSGLDIVNAGEEILTE